MLRFLVSGAWGNSENEYITCLSLALRADHPKESPSNLALNLDQQSDKRESSGKDAKTPTAAVWAQPARTLWIMDYCLLIIDDFLVLIGSPILINDN